MAQTLILISWCLEILHIFVTDKKNSRAGMLMKLLLKFLTQMMTLSICCLDNQRKLCMLLLLSCFDMGHLKHGCMPWIEPLSRGTTGLFQMSFGQGSPLQRHRARRYLSCKAKAMGFHQTEWVEILFHDSHWRIRPRVFLVEICINKLQEQESSVGRKLCMYYTAREWHNNSLCAEVGHVQ